MVKALPRFRFERKSTSRVSDGAFRGYSHGLSERELDQSPGLDTEIEVLFGRRRTSYVEEESETSDVIYRDPGILFRGF